VLTDAELYSVRAVLAQPDGRIALAGQFNDDIAVVRLKENGANDDTTFERVDFGYGDEATAAALTPAGEIVVAGIAYGPPMLTADNQAAVVRYRADGKLDKTLAGTGMLTFGSDGTEEPGTVLVRPDGGVVVAGYHHGGDVRSFVTPVSREGAVDLGTAGRDTLRGTRHADVIVALGGAGNDRLSGGAGRDRLLGEGGRDRLVGGGGRDRLVGGPGRDRLRQ
jgi:uncharacterized delta-60 repeat protein